MARYVILVPGDKGSLVQVGATFPTEESARRALADTAKHAASAAIYVDVAHFRPHISMREYEPDASPVRLLPHLR